MATIPLFPGAIQPKKTNLIHFSNPRNLDQKKIQKTLEEGGEGGEGLSIGPLPSTFNTIHSTDVIFGTYNQLLLYFLLSKVAWSLIGFHGNRSDINDVTSKKT